MRGIMYRFESFEQLSLLMEAGGDERDLELPCCEDLREGEWLLVTFSIGDETTAVAGCVVDRGAGLRLAFEDRDWECLWHFANADGPPSMPPKSMQLPPVALEIPSDSRVLLVDDDTDLQNVLATLLRGTGFGVSSVGTAEEAFDFLRAHSVDLIVLDWNLPGMTGIDFCRRLRKERSTRRLPVLFLTAHSSSSDIVEAFSAGADDFVSKPFRAPELSARILGLLRRAQMPPPSARRPS